MVSFKEEENDRLRKFAESLGGDDEAVKTFLSEIYSWAGMKYSGFLFNEWHLLKMKTNCLKTP